MNPEQPQFSPDEDGFFQLANASNEYEDMDFSGEDGFFNLSKHLPYNPEEYMGTISDYGKSIIKGTMEGVQRFGRMMGPLMGDAPGETEAKFTEQLEEYLPQEKEGFIQSSLRRGLREAPTMMSFPGSTIGMLPRSIAAGFMGEGAKELGAPEWAQIAAEMTAYMGPELTKHLIEKGQHAEIVKYGKEFGLTDEQIAPLLNSDFKQKWLTKLTPRRGRSQKILQETYDSLGSVYSDLRKLPGSNVVMHEEQKIGLMQKLGNIVEELPDSVRQKVKQDLVDLVKKPITIDSLMNVYHDINHAIGPKTKELFLLKQPIRDAIHSINPSIGSKFDAVNTLYSRYGDISGKLKPSMVSDLTRAAESLLFFKYIVGADATGISAILAEQGARLSARELLLNPRFQQLGQKTVQAINQNKFGLAKKFMDQLKSEVSKEDPSIQFEDLSEEELRKIFD